MKWNPDLSLGNVLTMGTMVIGLSVGYATTTGTVAAHTSDIKKLDDRLTAHEQRFNDTLALIAQNRLDQTTILTEMRTELRHLREAVNRMQPRVAP